MDRNALAEETSPYLLQHKDNPVHWQAWSPVVLAAAEAANKPILLSVGYSACHWCHVMAHECFEDPAIAALMNTLFVSIKVDREERPDLDAIYQHALALLGEQGGWPLTMFLTPRGEPFWGGTYFPPSARWGRPGFPEVLRALHNAYTTEPEKIAQNVGALRDALQRLAAPQGGDGDLAGAHRPAGPAPAARGRSHQWRHRRRAEISAGRTLRAAVARLETHARAAAPRRRRAHARTHLARRHLRPCRRRLCALRYRRALAGAAFREDALRQRAAHRSPDAGLAGRHQRALRHARRRDHRLGGARDADRGGRLRVEPRRRQRA